MAAPDRKILRLVDDRGIPDIGDDALSAGPATARPSTGDDDASVIVLTRGAGDDSTLPPAEGTVDASRGPAPKPGARVDPADRRRMQQAWLATSSHSLDLGRYVITGTLGRGGMGVVFKAFDPMLDRRVALKVMHIGLDERRTGRTLREAQALAKLSHPNVVQVYEVGQFGGQTFVAMELVRGQTLEAWMRQEPRPSWRQCVEAFVQAGAGLAAAHEQGLVHRDFKPGNAIIDDKGRVRVLDFGLARLVDDFEVDRPLQQARTIECERIPLDVSLTKTGAVLGTPAYMPPEQMSGREADARSDQFSFCVALYEALYGERPYEGYGLPELLASTLDGTIRPAPRGRRVPNKLRALLTRGLDPEPARRWSSMEALLEQLHALVTPRRRPWLTLGVKVALAVLGGGLAYQGVLEHEAMRARGVEAQHCQGARDQLDGIWDDVRRQQVGDAITGSGLSYASDTWQRVEQRLDAYADAWVAEQTEVCEARPTPDGRSLAGTLARAQCLTERRTALRAAVDVLARADARAVEGAVEVVTHLPSLTRCDDIDALLAEIPPPEDPEVAQQVQSLRDRLAGIKAAQQAGRYAEALEQLGPMVERAEALGYGPLQAEVRFWYGELLDGDGQYAEAEQQLKRAHALALEHGHAQVELDAAQRLTYLVGDPLARHDEGLTWGQMALALARRSGEDLELAASLYHLGIVFHERGEYEQAERHHRRALQLREKVRGAHHPDVAMSLNNLGIVLKHQGKYEQAEQHYRRALRIRERALGPDHPHVAMSLNNLGIVLKHQGKYEQAEQHYRRALRIHDEALGPGHPGVAMILNNLGVVLQHQGKYEQAEHHHQRALQIREQALGPDHPQVAYSLSNLGIVFESRAEYERAKDHHERALRILEEALGPDHPHVATCLFNLGQVLQRRGEHEQAEQLYERALQIQDEALGPDHPDVARLLTALAEAALEQHHDRAARAYAERAVSIHDEGLATRGAVLVRP